MLITMFYLQLVRQYTYTIYMQNAHSASQMLGTQAFWDKICGLKLRLAGDQIPNASAPLLLTVFKVTLQAAAHLQAQEQILLKVLEM